MKKIRDHYFHKAKAEGFAARSAYKLEEIDRRHHLLRPGMRVLELGCAPGSWLQYTARRVGPKGTVVGVDPQPVSIALPPNVRVLAGDVLALSPHRLIGDGRPFDVMLSDMAPSTTGIKSADAARSAGLARQALALAGTVLLPGGALLVKVFQGARLPELRREFNDRFERVSTEKPGASRPESVEVFLLGQGKREDLPGERELPAPTG